MSGLSEVREELTADLTEVGLTVFDHVPEKVAPPVVLVSTGDPYVTEGDTFDPSQMKVSLELLLIAGKASNSVATKALDGLIERVLLHLPEWHLIGVSAPFMGSVNDATYLTSSVQIARIFTVKEGA